MVEQTIVAPSPEPLAAVLKAMVSANRSIGFAIPGAVLAVSGPDNASAILCAGVDGQGEPLGENSLHPIGSASKLALGLLLLQLIDSGEVALDAPLADYVPEARASQNPKVTIRRLMSHTSGLPLEVPHELSSPPGMVHYMEGLRWPGELASGCLAAELVAEPGSEVRYSNVGFGLLTLAAERICQAPIPELLQPRVFAPLHVEAYCGRVPDRKVMSVADVSTPYAGTNIEPVNSAMWIEMAMPWSGVLTTAAGLLRLVRAYLDNSLGLNPQILELARSDQTNGVSGGFPTTEPFLGHAPSRAIVWKKCPWGLALELQGGKRPHWGPATLPNSFGQIGASGCIGWCDPEAGVAWALIASRTADSGWLLLHGPRIAQAALTACAPDRQC